MPDVPSETFHAGGMPFYDGPLGPAVNKRGAGMTRVRYAPVHPNAAFEDARAGRGAGVVTWVFNEEPGTAEGLFQTPLAFFNDTRMEPHASVGLHPHPDTEEIYYLLEGTLTVTTVLPDGTAHTDTLGPGDAHLVRLGQSHTAEAGTDGCRFVVVAVRATPAP
jgi:quercetin dioxygenase-like cupin family protein